jgi:hypothetical protein
VNDRLAAVLLATACGGAGCGTAAVDSAGPAAEDSCGEAASFTTWDNWGEGFFAGYCRTCHSAATADRRGAPAAVNFDSEAEVEAQLAAIERTVLDDGTMPVGGGVPDVELERLRAFLACGR